MWFNQDTTEIIGTEKTLPSRVTLLAVLTTIWDFLFPLPGKPPDLRNSHNIEEKVLLWLRKSVTAVSKEILWGVSLCRGAQFPTVCLLLLSPRVTSIPYSHFYYMWIWRRRLNPIYHLSPVQVSLHYNFFLHREDKNQLCSVDWVIEAHHE